MAIIASRVKAGWYALLNMAMGAGAVWLLLDSTPTYGPRAWLYQQPTKTLLFVPWAVFCAFGALTFLYWVATPLPFLRADETGMTLQRWPLVKRTVAWTDTDNITAVKMSTPVYFWKSVTLTLWVTLRPQAAAAYGDKSQLKLTVP